MVFAGAAVVPSRWPWRLEPARLGIAMPLQIMKLSRVRRMGMVGVVGGGMEASMDAAEEEINAPAVSEIWRAEEVMAAVGGCGGTRV
jgi:hypothetical protein